MASENYLEKWAASVIRRPSANLRATVEVEGLRNEHLGPIWEYAKVKMRFEPSERFEVQSRISVKNSEQAAYLNAAIMGLLDALLVTWPEPLINVHVTLLEMEEHEVDSSQRAFLMAGRNAGLNLLQVAREQALAPPGRRLK
jgi:Elongation factor G, domain IV